VHFAGYVGEKEKMNYLASADIAVFPSTGGESFGIVLIEAMAAGADTVIAGNNVGYRFVMDGRKEQLVNPKNISEFSKKLRHYITSSRARTQTSHWQEEHVKQFDVRAIGGRLLSDYQLLIAKRKDN
jgi:phosphatidyl-myo-inositol alpha-mannosyltransferase